MTRVTFRRPYARPEWRARPELAANPEPGADYQSVAFYNPGETAAFPDDEAAYLLTHKIATPATTTTNGGSTERTEA